MKNKDKTIYNFILKELGLEISPLLENAIMNPTKVETINNNALEQIVNEIAPIYKKYRFVLDGPQELSKICTFMIFLDFRLNNQPKLRRKEY